MVHVPAAERREQIIQAAVEVIATHGVDGATTRKIAEAAGAALATFHYIFPTKDDLFQAIYDRQLAKLTETSFHIRHQAGLDRTAASVLRQIIDLWTSDPAIAHAEEELYLWSIRQDRNLGIKICEVHKEAVVKALEHGLREEDDPRMVDLVANLMIAIGDGTLLTWLSYRDKDRLMTDVDFACEALEVFIATRRIAAAPVAR